MLIFLEYKNQPIDVTFFKDESMHSNYLLPLCALLLTACSHEKNSHQQSIPTTAIEIDQNLSQQLLANHLAINFDSSGQLANQDLAAFAKKIEHVRILALGE